MEEMTPTRHTRFIASDTEPRERLRDGLTIPTMLGFARILGTPFIAWCLVRGEIAIGFYLYAAAALTDAFDGALARRFHWESRLGGYVDAFADKILINTTFLVLAFATQPPVPVPVWLALPVLARDLIVFGGGVALHATVRRMKMAPTLAGKLTVIFQMTTTALLMFENYMTARHTGTFVAGLLPVAIWATLIVTLVSGAEYVVTGWAVYRHGERRKKRAHR